MPLKNHLNAKSKSTTANSVISNSATTASRGSSETEDPRSVNLNYEYQEQP